MTPLLCTDSKLNSTLKRYKKKKISQFLFLVLETRDLSKQIVVLGWRDFAEVRALASLKCGLGSIPSRHHIWVDFIVNFRHVPRVFLGRGSLVQLYTMFNYTSSIIPCHYSFLFRTVV